MSLATGQAAVLPRSRAGDVQAGMVSAMGAVLPSLDVLGTKVYSTRLGQFQFVVNLFSVSTGLPLATLEANELTRVRTSATTALALDLLAPKTAQSLAVFGAGTQARAHLDAVLGQQPLRSIDDLRICARSGAEALAEEWRAKGFKARAVSAEEAAGADIVLTCTRASEPLFDGDWVKPGAFVAAVGSSKPVARELDDRLLARAACIAVEWKPAAEAEAGEFKRAAPGTINPANVRELGHLLAHPPALNADEIVVYKSVGIGLEDIALAHAVLKAHA
jgi:ornithine cyclodeaminase